MCLSDGQQPLLSRHGNPVVIFQHLCSDTIPPSHLVLAPKEQQLESLDQKRHIH
ncbi:unnamed protein product [Merluccius merluccius]